MKPSLVFSPLSAGQLGGAQGVAKVEGDRLFAQHVLAGFQRRHRQLEVRVARRADVDHVDVVPVDDIAII